MKYSRQCLAIGLLFFIGNYTFSQPLKPNPTFTRQDTLRGSITPARAWWDVTHYDITVQPDFDNKKIKGIVLMSFKVIKEGQVMQIDLQQPMQIDAITWKNQQLTYQRDSNVFLIRFPEKLARKSLHQVNIVFSGKPKEAVMPPWDGGWIWKRDKLGNPWMTVACQGLGASVWYPCKDHQSDEPDSANLRITVPDTLVGVGNGKLTGKIANPDKTTTFNWRVSNPINNYNIIPYIGKYSSFTDTYAGEKGKLDISYWVLNYNVDTAKRHMVKDVNDMLKSFEYWFGPYPFYEDGYKLVESPHLGMEHQSAVAYGNQFKKGYAGNDLSASGWGLKWDFIIIHESGHEWFGNNITTKDVADMWVHEGFTNYSETLFTESLYGKPAALDYISGIRRLIENDKPVIGHYGVNAEGSGDMYYKGGNMLHTIRQIINNDDKFRNILRGLNKKFYHSTVTGAEVEKYISSASGINLSKIFEQYLRTVKIPNLEYTIRESKLYYQWERSSCVAGFNMPVKIIAGDKELWLKPTFEEQQVVLPAQNIERIAVDRNFFVTCSYYLN